MQSVSPLRFDYQKKTHAELTRYAAEHKITMTEVALRSLEEYLSKRK